MAFRAISLQSRPDDPIELCGFPVDEPQNIACLRGIHLRLASFTEDPDRAPYKLSFIEHGQSSGAISLEAIEQIVPGRLGIKSL